MKKDILKSNLVKKKPVIEEREAQDIVTKIHGPNSKRTQEEENTKTSLDLPISLFKAMKIKLIQEDISMRDYIIALIKADMRV